MSFQNMDKFKEDFKIKLGHDLLSFQFEWPKIWMNTFSYERFRLKE